MKFTNISKFVIKFMKGGKINFPFNYLKEVEINGDNDGEGGGESPSELTKIDVIENYVNILYGHYNIEFDVIEETSSREEPVINENFEPTGEVITVTQKNYKFVPKTNVPRVYLNRGDGSSNNDLTANNGLTLNATDTSAVSPVSSISKIIFNNAELTIQQLINYDIVQVGIAKFYINAPNYYYNDYAGYLEYLDWIRNNTIEGVEIPILLYGEPSGDTTRNYNNSGFIPSELFLNGNKGFYSQSVYEVLEEQQ